MLTDMDYGKVAYAEGMGTRHLMARHMGIGYVLLILGSLVRLGG